MPLLEELSIWKCPYCDTENDHTNHRCWKCNKQKPKRWSIAKGIITKRTNKERKAALASQEQKIEKHENPPVAIESDLTFDLEKLQSDKQMSV